MKHYLNEVEAARQEAELIIGEGVGKRFPLALSLIAVRILLEKRGLPLPEDVLAWVSNGEISDSMIENPHSVFGTRGS